MLGLFNLAYIPIPWLDEAACLEPAVMWQKTGRFVSKAWPTPGTEQVFLSYPPAIVFLHRFTLSIFPAEVFWVRLPFLILHVTAILLLFNTLTKNLKLDARWAALLCLYFLFDKAVFEISRSVRSEVIEVFLLSAWFWIYTRPQKKSISFFFLGLICGALLLTHLKEWPVAAVFSLWLLWQTLVKRHSVIYLVSASLLPIAFLWFIDFRFAELYRQLFTHSMEHSAGANVFTNIYNYFIGRFYPVYKEQPWLPLLHLWITWLALKQVKNQPKISIFAAIWLFAGAVWLFALGPYYRYFLPMYFTGIFIVAAYLKNKHVAFPEMRKWYLLPVYFLMLFPFLSRHLLGIIQRPERDPQRVMQFLEKQLPKDKKILVYGNEIGMYYAANHSNADHTHETSPDHFQFNEYDTIYYLTDKLIPLLHRKSTYHIPSTGLPDWMYKLGRGGTFANMHVYVIQSDAEWKQVATPFYGWD